jgi:hypothetical protein
MFLLIYSTLRGIEGQERGLLLPAAGLGKKQAALPAASVERFIAGHTR